MPNIDPDHLTITVADHPSAGRLSSGGEDDPNLIYLSQMRASQDVHPAPSSRFDDLRTLEDMDDN